MLSLNKIDSIGHSAAELITEQVSDEHCNENNESTNCILYFWISQDTTVTLFRCSGQIHYHIASFLKILFIATYWNPVHFYAVIQKQKEDFY